VENVFNLDSRIVKTLTWLFIPAKLTQEYFKGKHKTYYHPIRLYLVMSIIFFAVLNLKESPIVNFDLGHVTKDLVDDAQKEVYFSEFKTLLDSINQEIIIGNNQSLVKETLDTLMNKMPITKERDSIDLTLHFPRNFKVNLEQGYKFDKLDMLTLAPDSLIKKYEVNRFYSKIAIKQSVRFMRDQGLFAKQIASSLPLMLLAMMPALALFMKLLYVRRRRFFIEHLVFNFHHHAFMFLVLSLLFLIPENHIENIIRYGIIGVFIFLFIAMKLYYEQGVFKTLLKYILFNLFYLLSFLLMLVVTFIISLLLF